MIARGLLFADPAYPGGRIRVLSGTVTVGAIFPPQSDRDVGWRWRLWVTASAAHCADGTARSLPDAQASIAARWQDFLAAAGLVPANSKTPR